MCDDFLPRISQNIFLAILPRFGLVSLSLERDLIWTMGERINPKTCSHLPDTFRIPRIYDDPSLHVTNLLMKHHQLWFSDGAIIAVAAAGTVGFRLHIGFLIYSCATFKEISGTPLSAFSNETFEGCVVIHMWDDESDLINFFLALYNPLSFNFDIKSASNFQKVAGVMHLAHKYGCEVLVTHIRNALFSCYPPSHRLAWHGSLVCSPKAGPSPVQVITLALLCSRLAEPKDYALVIMENLTVGLARVWARLREEDCEFYKMTGHWSTQDRRPLSTRTVRRYRGADLASPVVYVTRQATSLGLRLLVFVFENGFDRLLTLMFEAVMVDAEVGVFPSTVSLGVARTDFNPSQRLSVSTVQDDTQGA
ncbi:hypothetical protein K439DRAFT_1623344 [Ramaria rubella]|nr:hypothetical protein K439DRAFT_1623344 [Ramaria rubella]